MADYVIMLNNDKPFTTAILKKDAIIYCKRDYIDHLFENLKFSNRNYILITHASDYAVSQTEFNRKPKCIKKWFAENTNYSHPDLIPIPIGLAPDQDIDSTPLDVKWFLNNIEKFQSTPKNETTLYCNWTNNNNPKLRTNVLNKLAANNIKYIWDYPSLSDETNAKVQTLFKQMQGSKNPDIVQSLKEEISDLQYYYTYCNNMSKYKFVIAPEGNGIDTHRVWEALYMNSIPIVLNSHAFNGMEQLPIIKVNDYSEVTYDLLSQALYKEYNYDQLSMDYWTNKIENNLMKYK
jgi:hypothetical protein